jgi:hypothetical protein
MEAIALAITTGDWYYTRIRAVGNVVDSITGPRKKQLRLLFIMEYKKYKFIHNTKCNFISKKYYFYKLLIMIESMISYNLNLTSLNKSS